jgi:hypothetical protein
VEISADGSEFANGEKEAAIPQQPGDLEVSKQMIRRRKD